MADDTGTRHIAIDALTDMFAEMALAACDMDALESDCIDLGHECMACALSRALEALDDALMRARGEGLAVHGKRPRAIVAEIGDVFFLVRRYRDEYGCDVYLLADRLDIPYGACVPPGAAEFLTTAASICSCGRAASLLGRHGSLAD